MVRAADGSGEAELLMATPFASFINSWSPDGSLLTLTGGGGGGDIFVASPEGGELTPFADTRFFEANGMFSPDGAWLAYSSDETGRNEIYARPFPGPGAKVQISTEGGEEPAWAASGRELYYRNGNKMMATAIDGGAELVVGGTATLFERPFERSTVAGARNFDVADDGRFILVERVPSFRLTRLNVILNWVDSLERLATSTLE